MVAGRYRFARLSGRSWLRGMALGSLLIALSGADSPPANPQPARPLPAPAEDGHAPFAVVELFTSEFCGACPAADQLLSEIGAEARRTGRRIMPLAFHVDYFDRGSAVDPFGSPLFSKRQRAYAAAFNAEDLYTPQMIVNGRNPFVGSERATASSYIRAALQKRAAAAVRLSLSDADAPTPTIRVKCQVTGADASANLQIALVERNLSTRARSGGQLHDNVVRAFKTVSLSKGFNPTVELTLPRNLNRRNVSVVGFVQDARALAIHGASSIELEPAANPAKKVAAARE